MSLKDHILNREIIFYRFYSDNDEQSKKKEKRGNGKFTECPNLEVITPRPEVTIEAFFGLL